MSITRRTRTVVLVGAIMLATGPLFVEARAGAAKLPAAGVPVGPGAEFTVLSKGTTSDPFEITSAGPTQLEWAQVSVAPHGTTGLADGGGIVVATVTHGVATALSSEAGSCARRSVETGASFGRPAGRAGAILNDTSDPLELTVVTLTPTGRVDALPAGSCPSAAPDGVTSKVLQRSIVEQPLSAESKGSSDIWVGLVNFAAGGTLPWHVQQRPYFLGVSEGHVTLALAEGPPATSRRTAKGRAFSSRLGSTTLRATRHRTRRLSTSSASSRASSP
jgi:hypothetical protein